MVVNCKHRNLMFAELDRYRVDLRFLFIIQIFVRPPLRSYAYTDLTGDCTVVQQCQKTKVSSRTGTRPPTSQMKGGWQRALR